jgi:hypothetical protein
VSVDLYNEHGVPDEVKREKLQKTMDEVFSAGKCTMLLSKDPSEIAVFYYVDGLPISAIDDLKGRCLNAFLSRRQQWRRQQNALNGNTPIASIGSYNQRVGVPVYSGSDAEARVIETCVIKRLYEVKGSEVGNFSSEDIPELGECKPQHAEHHEPSSSMNGHVVQPVCPGSAMPSEPLAPDQDNQPGQ